MSGVPVALFAYARPDHLRRTVASLLRNPEAGQTALYVFCDAAKSSGQQPAVDAVRRYVDSITGFASVTIVRQPKNLGLAQSIISGVSSTLEHHESVIVLEDDLVVSPYFLSFMRDGLDTYVNDPSVASIHGYRYPVRELLPETFFLRGADCWGWATWRRAWRHFRADGQGLLTELRDRRLTRSFDLDGCYPFTQMLADQVGGRNDSWAIRWHASCYLSDMLTLYPGRSLVVNIGQDSSGTHSKSTIAFDGDLAERAVVVARIPLIASNAAREAFKRFLRPSLARRVGRALRRIVPRLK
jgi:hypothetical protein